MGIINRSITYLLIVFFAGIHMPSIHAYQMTVPTSIYVENTYNLKPVIGATLTVRQKEADQKYYTYGTYQTDSLGIVNLSLNHNKVYTVTTKKKDYYTQITVLSTNEISRTGKNKFGLSMRPKNCYRIRGKVQANFPLTGKDYFILEDLDTKTTETVAISQEGYYAACGQCGKTYSIQPFLNEVPQQTDTIVLLEQYCQEKRNPLLEFNIRPQEAVVPEKEAPEPQGKYAKGDSVVLENLVFEGKTRQLNTAGNEALAMLYQILFENPKLIVELYVHTDARKSERYNWLLAKKRGKLIQDFLLEKGIEEERFMIVPVGEGQFVNDCTNGKNCSKAEHAKNNRVEMKVLQGDKDFLNN